MFTWLKNLFKSFHTCIDNVPVRLLNGQEVAAYLHSCPTCGKTTELGVDAQMHGKKFGNFYSIRESLRAHKRTNENSIAYKLMLMRKGRMKFKRTGMGFRFYEVNRPTTGVPLKEHEEPIWPLI